MKKKILVIMIVLFSIYSLFCQAQNSFTAALQKATESALRNAEKNQRIAIVHVTSPNAEVYELVLDDLQTILVGAGYRVMNRNPIKEILTDFQIGISSEIDDNVAINIGTHVDADLVLVGSIDVANRRVRLRILDKNSDTVGIATEIYSQQTVSNQGTNTTIGSGWEEWISKNASGVSTATIFREGTLTQKFAQLQRTVDSHGVYVLEVNENERIREQSLTFSGAINVYIILLGVGGNRTINLQANEIMFTVKTNITLILDNNITLQGHSGNTGSSIIWLQGGRFVMLNGSRISGNECNSCGGALCGTGTFEMLGGTITNNSGTTGGAINLNSGGTFNMYGGTISGNKANRGAAVYINGGTFNMRGGTITGNFASQYGGGVYRNSGTFNKTGGTIVGSDQDNGNRVQDESGTIARRGHAVYVSESRRKETTSGQSNNLNSGNDTGWN